MEDPSEYKGDNSTCQFASGSDKSVSDAHVEAVHEERKTSNPTYMCLVSGAVNNTTGRNGHKGSNHGTSQDRVHKDGQKEEGSIVSNDDDSHDNSDDHKYELQEYPSHEDGVTEHASKLTCSHCSAVIEMKTLKHHLATVHPELKVNFVCGVCGKGFKFESGLILHTANHHGAMVPSRVRLSERKGSNAKASKVSNTCSILHCEVCGKQLRHISSLTVHLQKHRLKRILECDICDQPFVTEKSLQNHLQMHFSLLPNQCHVCRNMCGRSGLYREHINKHKSEAQYQCDKCPRVFLEATYLAVHLLTHGQHKVVRSKACNQRLSSQSEKDTPERKHTDEDNLRRCRVCAVRFRSNKVLKKHLQVVHKDKRGYTCNACGRMFFKLKHLQAHYRDHAEKKVIICNVCGEKFDLRSKLRRHMETHENDIIYKCVVCPQQYTEIARLEQHVSGHTEDCLDCCVCGLQLSDNTDIMVHVRKHGKLTMTEEEYKSKHKDSQGGNQELKKDQKEARVMAKCTICKKTFHFVSSLQSHLRIHQIDPTLRCHICGDPWQGVQGLREHIRTHLKDKAAFAGADQKTEAGPEGGGDKDVMGTTKKRHRCDICLERFISYYSCKTHRLLHTGEKPFRCDVCGKGFVLAGTLKIHMWSHTKEKPHVCEMCGKSFKQAYILREHQMSHTGKKPFLCDLCGKRFVNRKKLKLHNFVHTRETPFNCKVCGKGFRAFVTRQKHKCEGPAVALELKQNTNLDHVLEDNPQRIQTDDRLHMENIQHQESGRQPMDLPTSQSPYEDRLHIQHQESGRQPQDLPTSQSPYEDLTYLPLLGTEYSQSGHTFKHGQDQHVFGQDSLRKTPVGILMSRGDYMAPVSRYVDPRDGFSSSNHPLPVSWQLPLCNQANDSGRNHNNSDYMSDTNRTHVSWNKSAPGGQM